MTQRSDYLLMHYSTVESLEWAVGGCFMLCSVQLISSGLAYFCVLSWPGGLTQDLVWLWLEMEGIRTLVSGVSHYPIKLGDGNLRPEAECLRLVR